MYRIIILIIVVGSSVVGYSQSEPLTFQDKLFNMTTRVKYYQTVDGKPIAKLGTGFYFTQSHDSTKKLEKYKIWIISNRHILYPKEKFPDSLQIYFRRRNVITKAIVWSRKRIPMSYIKENLEIHENPNYDVAALDITDIFEEHYSKTTGMIPIYSLYKEDFLKKEDDYQPEVGDDVLVIGYPRGFHDESSTYPILKSGIISTYYGLHFRRFPKYLIDCELFPGSSGSLVIAKPTEIVNRERSKKNDNKKNILLMGIYEGQPLFYRSVPGGEGKTDTIIKDSINLGVVWYPEIIYELKPVKK